MTNDPTSQPAPYIVFHDFLGDDDVEALLRFVTEHEDDLRPSGVTTVRGERPEDVRRSRTLPDCEPIWPLFEPALTRLLPVLRSELEVGHFRLERIERQLTVHLDGDYFKVHNDSGSDDVSTRRLTYVYYFNAQPKRFTGGELRLYHSVDDRGRRARGDDFVDIHPTHNSIVFFPSWVHHEVREVRTETSGLESARMTLTGWYHQPTSVEGLDLQALTELQRVRLPRFTERGFDIVSTPRAVHEALLAARDGAADPAEPEPPDPAVLPTGRPDHQPIGALGDWVASELHSLHEEWAGVELEHAATYGIRTYRRGQTLVRHCDRYRTHVISSIVHLDHDGEPWPIVIEDHAGNAHEVILEPGQMLLYESATCPHGRPEPFRGSYYSNVFVHFRPTSGWPEDLLAESDGVSPRSR